NYYIGKAAFDGKEYKRALPSLDATRRLNREQYYNPATLRIISAHYYLRDRKAATSEVDAFLTSSGNANVPPEVLEWLGIEYYNDKNYAKILFRQQIILVVIILDAEPFPPKCWNGSASSIITTRIICWRKSILAFLGA